MVRACAAIYSRSDPERSCATTHESREFLTSRPTTEAIPRRTSPPQQPAPHRLARLCLSRLPARGSQRPPVPAAPPAHVPSPDANLAAVSRRACARRRRRRRAVPHRRGGVETKREAHEEVLAPRRGVLQHNRPPRSTQRRRRDPRTNCSGRELSCCSCQQKCGGACRGARRPAARQAAVPARSHLLAENRVRYEQGLPLTPLSCPALPLPSLTGRTRFAPPPAAA